MNGVMPMLKFSTHEATDDKITECKMAMKKLRDLNAEDRSIAVKSHQRSLVVVNQQLSNAWHLLVYGTPRHPG
jgi:hypothetical protein